MKTINGNITDIECGVIVHQVNCRNRIGAGVSGVLIRKYPTLESKYHSFCNNADFPANLLGKWQEIDMSDFLTVINLFSQLDYGNSAKTGIVYTDMGALVNGLKKICDKYKERIVYVPYGIGCGLAGGSWSEVEEGTKGIENLIAVKYDK